VSKARRYPSLRRRKRTILSGKFLSRLERMGVHTIYMGNGSVYGGCLPELNKKIIFLDSEGKPKEFVPTKDKYTYEIPVFVYNAVDHTFDGVLDKTEADVLNFISQIDVENAIDKVLVVYSAYNSKPGDKEQFFCRLKLGAYSIIPIGN